MKAKTVQTSVRKSSGGDAGTIDLSPEVFGAPVYAHLVHQVVRWQLAKRRAGTHDVLTRSEMKGGKKKPFKQKGTGRARAGSSVSPLWVGGAVVHGPTPRSYEFKVPKGIRRKALCSALTSKVKAERLIVIDDVTSKDGKTKGMAKLMSSLKIDGSVLVILPENAGENTIRALGNLERVTSMPVEGINVYDVMKHKYVIVGKDSLKAIEARGLGKAE